MRNNDDRLLSLRKGFENSWDDVVDYVRELEQKISDLEDQLQELGEKS